MKSENLIGQQFGRLTVIESLPAEEGKPKRPRWKCLCDCGNEIIVIRGTDLKSGNTKSCGCLRSEEMSKKASQRNFDSRKYEPRIATARMVFNNEYKDKELTFEQFYDLSQQNCYYCNTEPSNVGISSNKKSSQFYVDNCRFIYNGLDRIDNNLLHIFKNVVACCKWCNYAKRNRTIEDFLLWAKDLYENIEKEKQYKQILITDFTKLQTATARKIYYSKYGDGNLTFEQFLILSQQNCYYCNIVPINIRKNIIRNNYINNSEFIYNGLDRLNNNLQHNFDNCVPCCKWCNYAKRERTVEEFILWAKKLYKTSKNKNART